MRKRLICFITSFLVAIIFVSSYPVSAYVAPSVLLNSYTTGTKVFSASSDGIFLVYTPYVCNVNPSAPGLSLLSMLDKSYLSAPNGQSLVWQGVERDSNICLTEVSDVVGFSQTYAYSSQNSAFVYTIVTCIPVVEGDTFVFHYLPNSDFVTNTVNTTLFRSSFLPYCTGVSKVYESFSTTSSECKYITKSDNQHFCCFLNPNGSLNYGASNTFSTSSSNLSPIPFYNFANLYTTTYGVAKNSEISVIPNSNVVEYSFAVYEIFDDGTTTPGIGGSGGDSSETSSSEQIEISNNILTNIKNLLSAVFDLPQKIAENIGVFFTDLKNSFVSAIEDLKNELLEGLEYLFIPSDNLFLELEEVIKEKFKFVYQIFDLGNSLISANYLNVPPNNKITLYGEEIVFMDWTLYDDYKFLIDSIIIFVSYYFYIQRFIKRIPGIIGGFHT